MIGFSKVPILLESNGFKSNTSTPCKFPRFWNLSRPVDWLRSVGTSPLFEPSPNNGGEEGPDRREAEIENARIAGLTETVLVTDCAAGRTERSAMWCILLLGRDGICSTVVFSCLELESVNNGQSQIVTVTVVTNGNTGSRLYYLLPTYRYYS
jgi:hypothetical protein